MGIYIPDVKLPPDDDWILVLCIQHDGTVLDPYGNQLDGKAIELPPHGRLGDLDALAAKDNADYEDAMASIADVSTRSKVCKVHYAVQEMIAEAETIIPAEEENDD